MIAEAPSLEALRVAREVVSRDHPHTALFPYASLSGGDGGNGRVFVKHENHTEIRSFKGRGALNALAQLGPAERRRGVVAASTGNHGLSIAWAGRLLGIRATVVVAADTPGVKRAAIGAQGAELLAVPGDLADAGVIARDLAAETDRVFIDDGNDPGLMAGAASIAFEVLEDLPETSTIVVPVGGGNLIAGIALAAHHINPRVRVVGVQSEAAPAVYLSWQRGRVVEAPCGTTAGGLATRFPGDLAFAVIKDEVDDMLLVSEAELDFGIVDVLGATGQLAEGAGAAPLAALRRYRAQLCAGDVVLVLSGGNIEPRQLLQLLSKARL